MQVSRTKRFFAGLINGLTLNGLLLGGLILLMTKRTSFGGLIMGYKFEGGSLVKLFFTKMLMAIGYMVTFSILWFVDVIGMGNRNGTFAEKMAGVEKV